MENGQTNANTDSYVSFDDLEMVDTSVLVGGLTAVQMTNVLYAFDVVLLIAILAMGCAVGLRAFGKVF